MADVLVFHHALGRTRGVQAFGDRLRSAGHRVEVPDLFDGETFGDIDDGVAFAESLGLDEIVKRARHVADWYGDDVAYVGFSLGVVPAQALAQTRPGARGAVLVHGCVPPHALGGPWPDGVPVEIHAMDADATFCDEGDLEAARSLCAGAGDATLHLYPGDQHLFADPGLSSYDPVAAALVVERTLGLLARC